MYSSAAHISLRQGLHHFQHREMESQIEIAEERRKKGLEEAQKEYANLRAELIRLRGKVWIYLRLRPKC